MDEPLDLSKKRPGPWDNSEMIGVYKVNVEENIKGELYVDLPRELMENLNWHSGDELIWEETEVLGEEGVYSAAYICRKVDWDRDIKPMLDGKDNE